MLHTVKKLPKLIQCLLLYVPQLPIHPRASLAEEYNGTPVSAYFSMMLGDLTEHKAALTLDFGVRMENHPESIVGFGIWGLGFRAWGLESNIFIRFVFKYIEGTAVSGSVIAPWIQEKFQGHLGSRGRFTEITEVCSVNLALESST